MSGLLPIVENTNKNVSLLLTIFYSFIDTNLLSWPSILLMKRSRHIFDQNDRLVQN